MLKEMVKAALIAAAVVWASNNISAIRRVLG
jgi:hypothetical protein